MRITVEEQWEQKVRIKIPRIFKRRCRVCHAHVKNESMWAFGTRRICIECTPLKADATRHFQKWNAIDTAML